MSKILFATGNKEKYNTAKELCQPVGIDIAMLDIDTPEIQSEDPKEVLLHKIEEKFKLSNNKPIIVSDDSWEIPGLKGFPGPYMKSIDVWFTPQNMLDLMQHVKDRSIMLHQYLAYKDIKTTKVFHIAVKGTVLTQAKGSYGKPMQKVISLNKDNGLSISEIYDKGIEHSQGRISQDNVWSKFIEWYQIYDK